MTDEPLIQKLMTADDTLSRGGAEQAIKIVREHDRQDQPKIAAQCGSGRLVVYHTGPTGAETPRQAFERVWNEQFWGWGQ